ncbi:hypothetical protein [Streptomyces rochei]|uniref:hypothetical protein n=1 Tax=Streptomyces rochei TaxID=1928 RepID=UPI004063F703
MSLFNDLHGTAYLLHHGGLHTGTQFASPQGPLDVCAAAYAITEGNLPDAFYEDEVTSIELIEASERAMAAIRAISHALDTAPCATDGGPDYIEHVSNWAATPPIGATQPPTTSEVIGRILRAADSIARDHTLPPHHHAA